MKLVEYYTHDMKPYKMKKNPYNVIKYLSFCSMFSFVLKFSTRVTEQCKHIWIFNVHSQRFTGSTYVMSG